MLGYVVSEGRGAADRCLAAVAERLLAEGWRLAGAIQVNSDRADSARCDMDLHVLGPDRIVRISQNLGALSQGCRLDPAGLEQAVGLVERALDAGPELLIVNKYGKQEIDGRGFRPVIGRSLAQGVPVLTAVNQASLDGFNAFAHDMSERIALDRDAVLGWCRRVARSAA
ncbi:hypothetical protein DEA8626_03057 [Defluviimonas aquaemixtae]|uniref:3-dehydroquinate dehydratase n=1 Tax=Albidovulum aquaemixtae TaxID=1542388 RepID=A0A2R8BKQ7_9RHOB|nr:DUF2478 domain-containing protein [Defluviimonas aquaemixtae]SPH24010.1 hypothetical protein DEA8626_03057 [Defluviimonas aquaemixtae]